MGPFFLHGPLPSGSCLFRGRQKEIKQLVETCLGPLNQYLIVFGGHRSGKTSLIVKLQEELQKRNVLATWVDFQKMEGANVDQAFQYIGDEVIETLGLPVTYPRPDKFGFARWFAGLEIDRRFVLLFDELCKLPPETRQHLANELRDTFHRRLKRQYYSLNERMVVLIGGDELFDLACTEVSTLISVCEEVYLPDLSEDEVIELVGTALKKSDFPLPDLELIGRNIYAYTAGQPYLTQLIGDQIFTSLQKGTAYTPDLTHQIALQAVAEDRTRFFFNLCTAIQGQGLLPVAEILLRESPPFSRATTNGIVRLELLGVVKEKQGKWVFRNQLIQRALYLWIDQVFSSAENNNLVASRDIRSGVYIEGSVITSGGDVIGRDKNPIIETTDKEDFVRVQEFVIDIVKDWRNRDEIIKTVDQIFTEIKRGEDIDDHRVGRRLAFLAALCDQEWKRIKEVLANVQGKGGETIQRVLASLVV